MSNDKDKTCKDDAKECSSANNSIAEFVEATSVPEPANQDKVDKTTEVSPMDRGAEDELDEVAEGEKAKTADGSAENTEAPAEDEATDLQEIAGNIGRPDSKVTSNSPKKQDEPVEHVDLDKTA
ncbi:unnamed protein product [Rotaria sordida]|uniref:Uncharacterized protein n=1 Tax=Rotaria sordida TaxID=392033 RepID=A0A813MEP9_9BILA|nr:unnamed protein product [Rotaria sordida]